MILRRCLLLLFVAITGCAVLANGDGWEARPSHAPLPAYFVDVDGVTLQKICGPRANWTNHGCAFRDYAHNVCRIYVEPSAPKWLAAHELFHCGGWDHEQQ